MTVFRLLCLFHQASDQRLFVLIFALGFEFWFHRKNLKVFCFFLLVGVSDTGIGLFLEVIGKASPLMIPESTATWRMGLGHFFHVSSVFIRPVSSCEMSAGPWHFDSVPVRSGLFGSSRKDLFQQVICIPERVLLSLRDWTRSCRGPVLSLAGAGSVLSLPPPPVGAGWLLRPLPLPEAAPLSQVLGEVVLSSERSVLRARILACPCFGSFRSAGGT